MCIDKPEGFLTDDEGELSKNAVIVLNDLLDYCDKLDKDVLFVVCPYEITQVDKSKYNTISEIIESRGYQFIDTNEYYEEMGIDYSKDFYNGDHPFGAKKFTEFLERYICENYRMPDHRRDEKYNSWNEDPKL